jgi:hypothetical protein
MTSLRTSCRISRLAGLVVLAVSLNAGVPAAQGKSGPKSVDACGLVSKAELETALGRKVQARKVPASTPATLGVSVCMWATLDGRRTLSVSTYAPEALQRTQTKTLQVYYDSLRTSNANNVGRPAQVLPGIARHASYFAAPQGTSSTVLVNRRDCIVVMNLTGLSKEEATLVARSAGN